MFSRFVQEMRQFVCLPKYSAGNGLKPFPIFPNEFILHMYIYQQKYESYFSKNFNILLGRSSRLLFGEPHFDSYTYTLNLFIIKLTSFLGILKSKT